MKFYSFRASILLVASSSLYATEQPAFTFKGTNYFHRSSQNNQHEFAPQDHPDLEKWSDMMTFNFYPDARGGEAPAAKANSVLENYKSHPGMVVRTNSVPRTPEKPAEHFIGVIFGRPNFIEVAFARLKLADRAGCSIVYSHRIYGRENRRPNECLARRQCGGNGKGSHAVERNAITSLARSGTETGKDLTLKV